MKQPPVTESFYEPRNPKAGHYYQCIEANFEELEMAWDDRYERRYGYWRPYIMDVIIDTWIAATCISVSPGSNARSVAMNICWPIPTNAGTFPLMPPEAGCGVRRVALR